MLFLSAEDLVDAVAGLVAPLDGDVDVDVDVAVLVWEAEVEDELEVELDEVVETILKMRKM